MIFSTWPGSEKSSSFLADAWNQMGSYDRRYLNNDGYLVVSRGVFALIGGPLALLYAVAIIERYSIRHIIGIIAGVIFMLLQIIYYAIEIHTDAGNFDVNHKSFVPVFIFGFVFYLLIPAYILFKESKYVLTRVIVAKKHDSMLVNSVRNRPGVALRSPYFSLPRSMSSGRKKNAASGESSGMRHASRQFESTNSVTSLFSTGGSQSMSQRENHGGGLFATPKSRYRQFGPASVDLEANDGGGTPSSIEEGDEEVEGDEMAEVEGEEDDGYSARMHNNNSNMIVGGIVGGIGNLTSRVFYSPKSS